MAAHLEKSLCSFSFVHLSTLQGRVKAGLVTERAGSAAGSSVEGTLELSLQLGELQAYSLQNTRALNVGIRTI